MRAWHSRRSLTTWGLKMVQRVEEKNDCRKFYDSATNIGENPLSVIACDW